MTERAPTDSRPPTGIVKHLNALIDPDQPEARAALMETLSLCCGSTRWAKEVADALPLLDDDALFACADRIWERLDETDFLEAFTHHPQIGADPEQLRARFRSTQVWAQGEQAGVREASEETIQALALGNREYLERFGYIFIVCATGKSADEMLKLLEARANHSADVELKIAAGEQAKITRIRLEKLR